MSRKILFSVSSLFLIFMGLALAAWPVSVFSIRGENGAEAFSTPVPEGWTLTSRIIHSLERTPVEDEYRVVSGRIWQWEERFRSNNAGLPTEIPAQGHFRSDSGWFITSGGRNHWETLHYRVGNSELGRNVIFPGGFPPLKLFEDFPGEKMTFSVTETPLGHFLWVSRREKLR